MTAFAGTGGPNVHETGVAHVNAAFVALARHCEAAAAVVALWAGGWAQEALTAAPVWRGRFGCVTRPAQWVVVFGYR